MRLREFLLSFITPVLVFFMIFFISCAQKERVSEDTEFDEQSIEAGELEEASATEEIAELTPAEGESPPPEEPAAPPDLPAEGDVTSLEPTPPAGDTLTQAEPNPDLPPPLGEGSLEPPPGPEGETNAAPTDIIDETKLGTTPEPLPEPSSGGARMAGLPTDSLPSIPAEAFEKGGVLLNRFYFARLGDTPEAISTLLYGTASRAKELAKWNGKTWRPGKLLYYSSGVQPDDRQMRSFYQEANVTPEGYLVATGDWLSKIAKKRYGDVRSWKEIAVVNGVDNPDQITRGQKLALYPVRFDGYSPGTTTAQNNELPSLGSTRPDSNQAGVSKPSGQDEAKALPPIPPPPSVTIPIKPQKKDSGAQEPDLDWGKMVEENMFFIAIGLVLIILLILLSVVNKRKKAAKRRGEFTDDGFAPPKVRRK